ncbi:MAG: PEGA domain-containing protein [Deltaproteobacteria bacterium]|nr:MAG: PEGA domain-containing protein [Deltaproteobacteria bacterium]
MRAFPLVHRLLAAFLAFALTLVVPPATARASIGEPAPSATEIPAGTDATVAVLPLEVRGEVSDADRALLERNLVEGLTRGAFRVVTPQDVAAAVGETGPCKEAACIQEAAKKTHATHVVTGIVVVEDRDYHVELALHDGASGARIVRTEEGCEICGIADAGELVATAAATLRTKLEALARGPSRVSIVSEPTDAVVTIDGEIAGTTPLERELVPGKHVIRISKEGHISVEREVTLVEGAQESLRFTLEKVPSRLPKRPWGYASLAVGIAALGTGIFFTALHDRPYKIGNNCQGQDVDRRGNCRFLWDTKWYGMAGVLAGAALVTLGIAVLLNTAGAKGRRGKDRKGRRSKKKAKRSAYRPDVGIGLGSLTVRGRF